jgi:hypothetical protein
MSRGLLLALSFVCMSGAAFAAGPALTAAEMKALLAKGLIVTSTSLNSDKVYTARINLAADGKLSGSLTPTGQAAIAVSGTWQLKGAQLCRTLAPIQPEEICETWLKSGNKEIVIQVDGKELATNRWQ